MLTKLKLFRSRQNSEALNSTTFTILIAEVLENYESDKK